jgi:hypothetical protein
MLTVELGISGLCKSHLRVIKESFKDIRVNLSMLTASCTVPEPSAPGDRVGRVIGSTASGAPVVTKKDEGVPNTDAKT